MFIIKATCDPYNARKHYNGQPVIKYDMTTPVEWVIEDGFASIEEAKAALMKLAKSCRSYESGSWIEENKETIRELADAIKEDHPEDFEDGKEPDASWFKGPGIYDHDTPVLLEGETSFRDDTMQYSVEETDAVSFALVLLEHQNNCRCTLVSKTEDKKNNGSLIIFAVNGEFETSAYIYDDGTLFHLRDWQGAHPETIDEIKNYKWTSYDGRPAVILEDAPRLLF